MAKYSNTVEYNIKTNLDASGIAKLNTQLRQVEAELQKMQGRGIYTDKQVADDLANIKQIQAALKSAFNPNLGMLDTKKFMAGLTAGGKSLQAYANTFNAAGTKGAQAFASWYSQLGKIDTGMRQISKTGDKIMNTLGNTVRWGLIASAFSSVMNAAHQSVEYVKDLDKSLTNIMMVSGESRDNMNDFAKAANEIAIRLGGTTTQMTEATKVFVQQGMNLPQSAEMAEYAVHLANISEQDSSTTSDELTAMKNAFHLEIDDMGNAVSKWAAIANNAAVSMEELSVASQKAASVANTVGVDMDQFAGHIAAIEATTREAPENIGNGLKTLYSRIADIKLGDTLEDGVNYGQFSSALKKIGVDVLDVDGKMKDAGIIIEEIMAKWEDLDKTQRNAVATTVAGRFQLARFEALMNSQDIYKKSVGVAKEETGTETYDRMQDTYRESLEGRSKALQAEIERIFLNAFETDSFYALIDVTTQLVHVFGDLIDAIGGGGAAITAFGAVLTKVMSNNISRGMANFTANRQRDAMVQSNIAGARQMASDQLSGKGISLKDADARRVVQDTAMGAQYSHLMNQQQLDTFNKSLEQRTQILGALKAAEAEAAQGAEMFGQAFSALGVAEEASEKGLMAFLSLLNDAGADIKQSDFATKEFSETLTRLGSAQSELTNLARAYEAVEKAAKEAGAGSAAHDTALTKAGDIAQRLSSQLEKLAKDENLSAEARQKLTQVHKLAQAAEDGDWTSLKKLQAAIKENQLEVNFYVEAMTRLRNEGVIDAEVFEKMTSELMGLREAFESTGMSAQIFNTQMANQQRMNGIVETVSAVGQLAFAWQAFKNLGSLWADNTIDAGKKLEETILNLGMNIPMLVMGFNQLQTALGLPNLKVATENIQKAKTALTEATAATEAAKLAEQEKSIALRQATIANSQHAISEAELTAAQDAEAAAHGVTTAAVEKEMAAKAALRAANIGLALSVGMIAATAAIMVATAAWGAYQKSIENAKQAEMDALNAASEEWDSLQPNLESWDELWEEFQKTGTASDEAKEKAGELASELGIVGGAASAAAGDFETLNSSIADFKNSKALEGINAAKDLLEGEYGKSLSGGELFNGSATQDYNAALVRGINEQSDDYGTVISESSVADLLRRHQVGPDASVAETVGEARAAIDELEQRLEDLDAQEESMDPQVFKMYKEEARSAKQALHEFLALDDIKAAEQAYKSLFDNGVQLTDFQERLANAGDNIKEMQNVFATDTNTKEYFNNLASEAEKLQLMLAATTDEAQKLSIQFQQNFQKSADKMMQKQMEAGVSQEEAETNTQDVFDQVSALNLDTQQGAVLLAKISEEDSIEAINEGLARIRESGDINDFKVPVELSEEELKEQVQNAIQSLSEDSMDADVDLETAKIFGEYLSKNDVEGYSEELQTNAEALKEVIEEQGRYDSALEKCQKNYEDWSDVLNNGSIVEQAKAGAELTNVYNDLLDIGEDLSVSSDFAQNAENLNLLKEAAEGTEGAYEKLQQAAARDILIHAGMDDSQVTAAMENIANIQDSIGDLEIGAVIEDEAVYQQLEQIINEAGFTADEASAFLSNIGVDIDPSAFEEGVSQIPGVAAEASNQAAEAMSMETEIETGTAEEQTTDTYSDVMANVSTVPLTSVLPAGKEGESSKTLTGQAAQVTYDVQTKSIPKMQGTAGFSVKARTKNGGGGGGGLTIKRGAARKGSSGGSKFSASPYGGGTKGGGGGGKGGGSCFIAGTLISLNGYYKSIETVQIGDVVLSYNEELKQNEYSEVLETMIHLVKEELYTLYIEDETLTATGIHRFLIDRNGKQEWIPASNLQINDLVLFADYSWHKITQIDIEIKATRVYNFEVSNNHNYYVGCNQILVHNKGGGGKSNKEKEPKETNRAKSAEVENDIYQKVNATLKKLNDQYSKLDKVTQRIYGPAQRNNINKQLKLIAKENEETKERVEIAKAYLKALQSGKSNPAYGISMKNKPSMKDTGLVDKDKDGVIDNYIQKFEAARQAAQAADKAADDYYTNLGGKIDKKGNVITEAKMTEDQQKEYEKLTKAAEKLWKKAEDINTVQKEYEDTWSQIREDEEKMLEYQQQMEDLMIDLYHTALDAADAIKDIKDSSAELKGLFAGFSSDSPFRALISDAQKFQDIMSATDKEFNDYIDDAVKVLEKELEAVESQGDKDKIAAYKNSIKWYKDKKAEYDANDIGKGELGMATLQLEEMSRWMEQVKKGELTGLPADSPYRTNTKQLFEDYEAQYKKVAQLTLEAEERMEKMQKDILDAYEYAADREQKILDKYNKIQEDLERTADRVTLWQGEDAYQAQIDLLKQQAQVAIENIQAEKKQYDTWVKKRDAAIAKEDAERVERLNQIDAVIRDLEAKRAAAKTKADKLDYEQQIAAQKALYAEQETAYSDATQYLIDHTEEMWEDIKDLQDEAAEAMRDAYLAQIDEINAAMTERLFGDRNLSNLTNDWDWDKEYFTTYKDTVEKTYETEKLRLKYMDLLDEAQGMSLATQRKIKQAMEEQLALLADQATVSKYDVDLANARLEILQKQIALENAQQNKTQMKLRRDTQGNYKYVYAADQGDVRDKESELLDAQFDAYEMSKEANRNAYDSAIGMYNQYVEQRKALAEKYKNDREKLDEELKKLDENYTRAAEANAEDLKNSYDGIVLSVEWMAKSNIENIANMTDEVLENLKEHNQEALEAIGIPWNDAIGSAIEDFETIKEEAANTTSELLKNVDEFVDFISGDDGIGAATGEQYGQAKEAINSAKDATKDLKEETENLNKALTQELGATSAAEEKIAEYEAQLRAAKESTSALASKLSSTEQTLINTQQEKEKYKTKYENAVTEAANEKRMRKGQFERGDEFVLKKGTVVYYGRGGGQSDARGRKSYTLEKDTKVRVQSTHQPVLDKNGKPTGQISQYHVGFFATDRKQVLPDRDDNPETRENEQWHLDPAGLVSAMKLDTGGYTGDWNNKAEGRLAILHEKELVLNRTDTENILNAVKLVRDAIAQIKAASITDVFKNTSNFSSHGGDTIEQRVEIVAEFPNANSAEEIKRALLGLADSAMQYSYREKSLT